METKAESEQFGDSRPNLSPTSLMCLPNIETSSKRRSHKTDLAFGLAVLNYVNFCSNFSLEMS